MRLTVTKWLSYPMNMLENYVRRMSSKLLDFQRKLRDADTNANVTAPVIEHLIDAARVDLG